MTDGHMMDANCVHGVPWFNCVQCTGEKSDHQTHVSRSAPGQFRWWCQEGCAGSGEYATRAEARAAADQHERRITGTRDPRLTRGIVTKLADNADLVWRCEVESFGSHAAAGCRPGRPHLSDDWDCGWAWTSTVRVNIASLDSEAPTDD